MGPHVYAMLGKGPTLSYVYPKSTFSTHGRALPQLLQLGLKSVGWDPHQICKCSSSNGDGGWEEPMGAGGSSPGRWLQGFPDSIPTFALCLLKYTSSLLPTYLRHICLKHESLPWMSRCASHSLREAIFENYIINHCYRHLLRFQGHYFYKVFK